MRQEQRHANVKKISTVGESSISDHKPKKLTLVRKWKKYSREENKTRIPRIKWEALRNENTEERYRQKVEELLEDQTEDIREQTNWQKISDTVTKAALEVCGREEKRVENPWMADKDEEVQRMRSRISRAIERKNELIEQRRLRGGEDNNVEANLALSIEELKEARKELKRAWEQEWWEEILTNCENAGERGDTFEVYKNLKKLGGRGLTKQATTTNLMKEEFKEHFQKVSKDRFENTPEEIDKIVEEIEDISQTEDAKIWSEQLDEVPEREEIKEQLKKMKDSAPSENGVRLSYLTKDQTWNNGGVNKVDTIYVL